MNLPEMIQNWQRNPQEFSRWRRRIRMQKRNILELTEWIGKEKEAIERYAQKFRERNKDNHSDELLIFLGRMDIPFDSSYYEEKNILVPGLFERAYVFNECDTPKASKHFDYNTDWRTIFSQSIESLGKKLADQVKQNTSKPVNLIGRSMGGLIVRKSLNYLTPKDVQFVATIATPHQGTYTPILISFLLGPGILLNRSCREMLPNSKLMEKLYNQKLIERVEYLNIFTDSHDEFCIPKANLVWPSPKVENISLEKTAGHADTLSNPQAWSIINERIKNLNG